jgi:hypothetical protein
MLELFKTQSVQELAGVPIMKRTVEVDEYTTITVQIAKEQTFIDITSTMGHVEVEKEEEVSEQDILQCPAGFIIRKRTQYTKGFTTWSEDEEEQGYIIAYNHAKKNWAVASYQDATGSGNTFAHASNIGWWHVPNKQAYSSCDVITWYGQSYFDFSPPTLRGYTTPDPDYSRINMLTRYFFFKGRKFTAPQNHVLGACIIDVANVDYIYVLTTNLANKDSTSGYYFSSLTSSRMKMSALLNGSTDWETAKGLNYSDFDFNADDTSGYYWDAPMSTAYIDKDGYAYLVMKHNRRVPSASSTDTNPGTTTLVSGSTEFIKFNMRNLSYEILNASIDCIPPLILSGRLERNVSTVGGGYLLAINDDALIKGSYSYTNVGRPWIFYALGGTKDLWTFALEWDAHGYSDLVPSGSTSGQATDYTCAGGGYLTCTVIVSKNMVEHERIPLMTRSGDTVCQFHRFSPYPSTAEFEVAAAIAKSRVVLEYHPEIANSMRYMELDVGPGGYSVSVKLVEGNKTVDTISDSIPADYSGRFASNGNQVGWFYAPPLQMQTTVHRWGLLLATLDEGTIYGVGSGGMGSVQRTFLFNTICTAEQYPDNFLFIEPNFVPGHNSSLWGGGVGDFGIDGGASGGNSNLVAGLGTRIGARAYIAKYGSAEGWWCPLAEDQQTCVPVEGFAVHRPTNTKHGTKAPYIYLKRKVRLCKEQNADHNSWLVLNDNFPRNRLSKTDPRTQDPWQPADYDQPTETYDTNDVMVGHSRKKWWMYTDPIGWYQQNGYNPWNPDDIRKPQWVDRGWTLESNVLTAKQLNKMTKDSDMAFFEIAVL